MIRTVEAAPAAAAVIPLHPPRPRRLGRGADRADRRAGRGDHVRCVRAAADGRAAPDGAHRRRAARPPADLDEPGAAQRRAAAPAAGRHASAASLARQPVTLALGPEPAAAIDPDWLQPPLADGAALIDGLADAGRRRLLKLFLTTGASLFGLDGASEFGRAAHRLLDAARRAAVSPASWCPLGRGRLLDLPRRREAGRGPDRQPGRAVGRADRPARAAASCGAKAASAAGLLHVLLPRGAAGGAALVGLGEAPVHLRAPEAGSGAAAAGALAGAARGRDSGLGAGGWSRRRAADDPVAAALAREIRHGGESPPRLAVAALSATPAGVLHALALEDPHGLVRAVRIERGGAAPRRGRSGGDRRCAGYAALARRSRFEDRYRLRLVYGRGGSQTVDEGRLAAYRGDIPAGVRGAATPARSRRSPGAAGARAAGATARACETFGQPPERPLLSVVAAVGDNLDLVRARAAMLFAEPGARGRAASITWRPAALAAAARRGDRRRGGGLRHRAPAGDAAGRGATRPTGCWRRSRSRAGPRAAAARGGGAAGGGRLAGAVALPAGRARPVLGGTLLDVGGAVIDAGGAPGEAGAATSGCRRRTCRLCRRSPTRRGERGLRRADARGGGADVRHGDALPEPRRDAGRGGGAAARRGQGGRDAAALPLRPLRRGAARPPGRAVDAAALRAGPKAFVQPFRR